MTKRPVGRPKVHDSKRRYGHTIMLTPHEFARLCYKARVSKSLSAYIRQELKL